jgi:FAD/FMN-containing dehydrogenase
VAEIAGLADAIDGEVLVEGAPGYEAARRPAMARFADVRPRAVVRCASPDDVAQTLRFARSAGLPVVPRSGGHCFEGRSTTTGIVIDVGPMDTVSVDGERATIGAGARLGAVLDALDAHGVAMPTGCGPEVGIAGLALGGGLGILGRRHGLTSDALRAARVVLADGRVVDCDERREPDLLWALRGAGCGTFGVVTELTFATFGAPSATAFHLTWPAACAVSLVGAWQGWSPDGPDGLAASLLVTVPPATARPPVVTVFGSMLAGEDETAALLGDLAARAGADPATAVLGHRSLRETKRWLAALGDTDDPAEEEGHAHSRSEFFARALPREAIEALVAHVLGERVPGEARELDFNPWGGAYTRMAPEATAFPHRDDRFLLKHAVVVAADAPDAVRRAARRRLAQAWAITHPWGTGGAYANFPDPDLADPGAAYWGANLGRLRAVKARVDPDGVFRPLG